MVVKRKHGAFDDTEQGDLVAKPPAGTQTFTSGSAVQDALAQGSRQAFVAFHQQILTLHSALPLAVTHPTATILQHYQSVSPTFDEVFNFWKESDRSRNERGVESAVALLVQILDILAGIPFFRTSTLGIVQKLVAQNEPYPDLINRLVQSGKRDHVLLGLRLAASAVQVDLPDPSAPGYGAGRLALKVWNVLVEGNSIKILGKVLGMRRRNKEGTVEYGSKDPLDRPDIRHAALHLLIPLFPLSALHAHGKTIVPAIYNNMHGDPPITIYRLLTGLWAAIAGPSPGIARRTALALLDENALEKLIDLLNREDVDPTSGKSVGAMVSAFLEATTTVPGRGICFTDQGWYPRQGAEEGEEDMGAYNKRRDEGRMRKGLHNRILSNVVRNLGSKVVDGQGRVGEWVIKVLQACPEIVAGYWPHSALSLDPRLDSRWLATIAYVGRIISLPPPPMSTFHDPAPRGANASETPPRAAPPSVNVMIESIFPSPMGKVHLTKGLQHSDLLVQHVTALALARGLQKLELVQDILAQVEKEVEAQPSSSDNPAPSIWTKRRLELELECKRRVPEVLVIISFAQKSATLARVPADSDDDPDPKLVAKSALLTEVALRLFGLYHKALPSVSREAKFDVGKLLVSASSAKAERREKREAREGSVISDTGSVGSVGTIGTVGMGGGFGQSRGDVDGFEAMSQVHVLSLLSQVPDWQWTNKASGSQYSYLYHILLLHLSTPHPITKQMTTSLLEKILLPSIMFEHDAGELEIWLSSLPNLSTLKDPTQRAWLVVQQIHLLSFLDECVRRCMKTPYRYIEDVLSVLPGYFEPSLRPYELVSPLFMTVLEQLRAKINGQLIATEAAGVVLAYLRRVMLGLSGKMKDQEWLNLIVAKLELMVKDARDKGQERKGLLGSVKEISTMISSVFGGLGIIDTEEFPAVTMIDEETWVEQSFEQNLISSSTSDETLSRILSVSSASSIERYGRFATHLYTTKRESRSLHLIQQTLKRSSGVYADRLVPAVFNTVKIEETIMPPSTVSLETLDGLVATVRDSDQSVCEVYVHDLLESMRVDKKGKKLDQILNFVSPWTRFFSPVQAKDAVEMIVKSAKRLTEITERVKSTISDLILCTNDTKFALDRIDTFVGIGVILPFVLLVRDISISRKDIEDISAVGVGKEEIERILALGNTDGYSLVQTLTEISPSAARSVTEVLAANESLLEQQDILPIVSCLLDLPELVKPDQFSRIVDTAIDTLCAVSSSSAQSENAQDVVRKIGKIEAAPVISRLGELKLANFSAHLAALSSKLCKQKELSTAVRHLVHLGLQHVTRFCSSDSKLDDQNLDTIQYLSSTVKAMDDISLDLDGNLVEPTVIAIVQERLLISQATEFASLLVGKSTLKASFIRQHLSLLFSSSAYNSLASPVAAPSSPFRPGFVDLLTALFTSNPYMTCQPNYVEQLLPLYKGTLSQSDQKILSLFQLFESYRHISVSSVLSVWSSTAGKSSRPFEALTSLEPTRVFATALAFPLRRGLRGLCVIEENEGGLGLYDPVFVLALLAAVLRAELTGLDWVEVLRTNCLGVAIMSLSSRDPEMRCLGGYLLAKTMKAMETVAFQEKPQLVYTLRVLRHSIESSEESKSQPRLPVIISTFLAHAIRSLAVPSNPIYPASSRFLLQRHKLDIGDVPMLFTMLYASGEGHKRDRNFIVRFIRDSTRSEADWRLLKRRKTVELFQTLYSSSLDIPFRRLVLQAIERITLLPPACLSLVHRSHFVTWLGGQWAKSRLEKRANRAVEEERNRYLTILENLVIVLVSRYLDRSPVSEEKGHSEPKEGGGGGGDEKAMMRGGKDEMKGKEWILPVNRLLKQALPSSDIHRLVVISRIVLRLSKIQSATTTELIPLIVERVKELYPNTSPDQAYIDVIQQTFRASLSLESGNQEVRGAVEELKWRVSMLDTDIAKWVRRERRLVVWEKAGKSETA